MTQLTVLAECCITDEDWCLYNFSHIESNMPPIPDFPALKRVDGKRHPLSSAEFEPSTEVLIDADESSDDVMDCASSIRSGK